MPYPKGVCVLGGAVGNFGEGGDTIAAGELENMGGILDDCSLLAELIKYYCDLRPNKRLTGIVYNPIICRLLPKVTIGFVRF